jgi:hypothetical protein
MALNGKWLFGTDGTNIYSYSIASTGAIALADRYNAGTSGGGPGNVFLDHTGTSLNIGYANLDGTGNNGYQAYGINQSTGAITYVNEVVGGPSYGSVLSYTSNDEYGYSSSCYHFTPWIFGMQRNSDGSLTALSSEGPLPTAQSGDFYCPFLASADNNSNLAVAVQPLTGDWGDAGPWQLATYSVNNDTGELTTSSTYRNMPKVLVGAVTSYWMSPSSKFLAVGGNSGLQIFHFNGAKPITKFTGLLTTDQVDQMFWDNAGHLYAISRSANKLYVFKVTPSGVTQAPGSPYSITSPEFMIVLPKT